MATDPRAIHGPPKDTADLYVEHLPWAMDIATPAAILEPSVTEEGAGHEPHGVGMPPDYRHENYHRRKLFDWTMLIEQAAIWVPRDTWSVTIGGTVDVGDQRRIAVSGNNVDHTVSGEASNTEIAAAFVLLLRADANVNPLCHVYNEGPIVYLVNKGAAGLTMTVVGSILADVGAADATCAHANVEAPLYARPNESVASSALGLVWGSEEMDDDGDVAHDARMLFDKVNAAFRAGQVQSTQWDVGNRGQNSAAFGFNCTASGTSSLAAGLASAATAARAIALGDTATADKDDSLAIGPNSTAGGAGAGKATAIGEYCQATGTNAAAIGSGTVGTPNLASGARSTTTGAQNTVGGSDSHSLGSVNVIAGNGSHAVGHNNEINDHDSVAVGDHHELNDEAWAVGTGAVVGGRYGMALGRDCDVNGERATAMGYQADAAIDRALAYSSQYWTARGDRQTYLTTLNQATTNATPAQVQIAGTNDKLAIPNNTVWTGTIWLGARCDGGAGGNAGKSWGAKADFCFKCDGAGNVTDLGAFAATAFNGDALGYVLTVDLTAANVVRFLFTGAATDDVKVCATARWSSITEA